MEKGGAVGVKTIVAVLGFLVVWIRHCLSDSASSAVAAGDHRTRRRTRRRRGGGNETIFFRFGENVKESICIVFFYGIMGK